MVSEVRFRRPSVLRSTGYLVKYKHSMGREALPTLSSCSSPAVPLLRKTYILEAVGKGALVYRAQPSNTEGWIWCRKTINL